MTWGILLFIIILVAVVAIIFVLIISIIIVITVLILTKQKNCENFSTSAFADFETSGDIVPNGKIMAQNTQPKVDKANTNIIYVESNNPFKIYAYQRSDENGPYVQVGDTDISTSGDNNFDISSCGKYIAASNDKNHLKIYKKGEDILSWEKIYEDGVSSAFPLEDFVPVLSISMCEKNAKMYIIIFGLNYVDSDPMSENIGSSFVASLYELDKQTDEITYLGRNVLDFKYDLLLSDISKIEFNNNKDELYIATSDSEYFGTVLVLDISNISNISLWKIKTFISAPVSVIPSFKFGFGSSVLYFNDTDLKKERLFISSGKPGFSLSGSVFIYEKRSDNEWEMIQSLLPPNTEHNNGGNMGYCVELSKPCGKYLIITCPYCDNELPSVTRRSQIFTYGKNDQGKYDLLNTFQQPHPELQYLSRCTMLDTNELILSNWNTNVGSQQAELQTVKLK